MAQLGTPPSVSQTGNTLTVEGDFSNGQPLLAVSSPSGDQTLVAQTYGKTSATFDLTGVAAGSYSASWALSCDDAPLGQVTIKGPSTVTVN